MWLDAFRALAVGETLSAVVLRDRLPLAENGTRLYGTAAERASGVMAARLALAASRSRAFPGKRQRLAFLVPQATQSLARYLAVSLLLADFVHREGSRVPVDEQGPLLRGDVLLVTQRIRRCTDLLRRLRVGPLPLSDHWQIEVLSKYTRSTSNKPRVFVANPGWKMPEGARHRFACAIVDASHPRTAAHLETVLEHPAVRAAPLQALVVPPWDERRLRVLGGVAEPARTASPIVWAWDPAAEVAIEKVAGPPSLPPDAAGSDPEYGGERGLEIPSRTIWVCDDEPVDEVLCRTHGLLAGAVRLGSPPRPVFEAYSVYHRLRQQAVPMLDAEEERRRAYGTLTLSERIEALRQNEVSASGSLGAYLDVNWPTLVETLKSVYDMLLERAEPAKFYTLASVVEEYLTRRTSGQSEQTGGPTVPLRIVAPTEHEGVLLVSRLRDLVDAFSEAMESGDVTLSTVREEARLVAEGQPAHPVLLGYRNSESRHLDVYPSTPVAVVSYPYEVALDEAYQRYSHATIEELQDDRRRSETLRRVLPVAGRVLESSPTARGNGAGGPNGNPDGNLPVDDAPHTRRAPVTRRVEGKAEVRLVRLAEAGTVEPLDVGGLWGPSWTDEILVGEVGDGARVEAGRDEKQPRQMVSRVEITDDEGERVSYPLVQKLDVYYPATERLERVAAGDVREGMFLVVLIDDRYEALFARLLEAMEEELPLEAAVALRLWRQAKQAALLKHNGNRQRLYDELKRRELSVDYAALRCYFVEGEEEIIAPRSFGDFEVLARESGIYTGHERLRFTFRCIERERGNRRTNGRRLHNLLRHLAGGAHYEAAIKSAGVLGTPVEHVAAAVELREVVAVRREEKTR